MHYNETAEAYAEFDELKGQKITDWEVVKNQINALTDKVAGPNGGIVNNPIKLTIHSKTCPDLTVIDLPGITRIPLFGSDQPKNIEEITKEMCTKYCQESSTIILCVIPANVDISTSEALSMARKLDPTGDRTIGVITKLDLMDPGTNAKNLLEGSDVALKNGYIALKNRSQQDLNDKLPIKVASQKEMTFFRSHPVYSKMNSSYFGIENLVEKLRRMFFEHLKLFLPGIYFNLKEKIQDCKKNLEALGSNELMNMLSSGSILSYLNSVINKFSENVEKAFLGKSHDLAENKSAHQIKLLYYQFLEEINKKPSQSIHNSYISEVLVRSEGDRLSGFPEATIFYEILSDQYENIKSETQTFYEKIYEEVTSTINIIILKYFKHFPPLKNKMSESIMEFVDQAFTKSKHICDSISQMNMDYLYIDENEFEINLMNILNLGKEVKEVKDQKSSKEKDKPVEKQKSDAELVEEANNKMAEYIKKLVDYYFQLILRNLRESIPKAMAFYFIKELRNVRSHLLLKFMQMETDNLVEEDPEVSKKRKFYSDMLKVLEKSEKLMLSDEE